ncbi:hypothetical protein DOTSEDRAFT_52452 [Dothistroma septosporum NZE10]|uniref:Helicase ATP-binding domain-containing protein n=1 Tax=Dothistroma septosporum (strain NZE10 / CBS 128990) TaxID=675120 RepID=N1PNS8_DOTSN|nr:hypothetical protein DOTSEDRAFT_52452 [Dothistroma septosporum NZE10]
MNESIPERFNHRSKKGVRNQASKVEVWLLPAKLNPRIREYCEQETAEGGSWLSRPEIPTAAELMDTDTSSSASSDIVEIAANRPMGAFEGREDYLSTQYELLREDATRPLREAVARVRNKPSSGEDAFDGQIGIYDKTHVCGTMLSTRGVALRVTFSLARCGKKILWEQSKRLISGSLVVLTPADDMFKTKAIVATVAARPLAGLQQNPPDIDLFFARPEELEIDPAVEYVMIEDRGGFFEADRHTLIALQHMMKEPFPLAEHLVDARPNVPAPQYVQEQPKTNLTAALTSNKHESYENVNILKRWPAQPQSELDASQLEALRTVLTKQLAIVQGPPGTGKTHVSVQAIKIMLENRHDDDPPIVIACQTNHAVDQILRHIAHFEPDFIRLGGRSKDRDVIKPRTLYEVRNLRSENPPPGCMFGMAKKRMIDMQKEFGMILSPLKPEKKPLDYRILENFKVLSKAQADSLESGASRWVQDKKSNPNEARSPFLLWLGDKLIHVLPRQEPEEYGFDFEEADLEFEQLKELEAENTAKDDEEFDTLSGLWLPLADNYTCRKVPGLTDTKAKELLKEQDMWKIPEVSRGAVYRYLQIEIKSQIAIAFRDKAKTYNVQAAKRRIGNWEKDEQHLKKAKVIGMTTTGFSKYRPLLAALQPRVVLIEEAAETLEAPVAVTCIPSLQHLILVGDHQQLRPHTHVKHHEDKPYYLNISLFERMVNNQVQYSILVKQRRMIPEIRRVLYPIYKNKIKDHPSVRDSENRPNVEGMGGVNSFFFTHQWTEQRDDQMSCLNTREADMIVGLVEHLAYNGVEIEDITILTFYNGQRKRILTSLRNSTTLGKQKFNVATVDSYQGEENKVVILSLVRSNDRNQIGFLDIDNRVCVALSRAQCGFYIFGNGMLLHNNSKTWKTVTQIMSGKPLKKEQLDKDIPEFIPQRLGTAFPTRCSNHDRLFEVNDADDWNLINGGCDLDCGGRLPCGHACQIKCHPFPHEIVNCAQCVPQNRPALPDTITERTIDSMARMSLHCKGDSSSSQSKSIESWNSYATHESARVEKLRTDYVPRTHRPDKNGADPLVAAVEQYNRRLPVHGLDGEGFSSSGATFIAGVAEIKRNKYKEVYKVVEPMEENLGDKVDEISENLIEF